MKKLTAGIFTVMLGLCATSGADAAVASQGYVDTKVGANTQSITELTGDVTALQTQVGEGTVDSRIGTAKQAAIDAAAADATTKANNALADAKADAEKYIDETELTTSQSAQNTAIETAYKAADKVITDSIGTVPADKTVVGMIAEAQTAATYDDTEVRGLVSANTNAISAINDAETGILAVAKKYADDNDADTIYDDTTVKADIAKNAGVIATLNGNDQTEGSVAYQVKALADGAVADNTTAIETLNGGEDVTGSVAKKIADAFTEANLSKYATTEAMNLALTDYELKSNLKALAHKDTVGTDDIDNLAVTTGKLANGAVTADKLGANAVTDAAVADGALSQGKINGLDTTLAAKMNITNAKTEAGKYVFTANVGDNGVTDYAWELIAREGEQ